MLLTKMNSYQLPVENRGGMEDFLSSDNLLEFSAPELLHAVVTCTFPASRVLSGYTRKRREELYTKCAMMEAALVEKEDYFGKSPAIGYLDSVEKTAVSYYLGLIFTKLVSTRIFHEDFLTHVQLMHRENGEYFFYIGRKKRSEMLGYQLGQEGFSVWASRGRSNNSLDALKEGLLQAQEVCAVQGMSPRLRAVCMTYYEKGIFSARVQIPGKPGTEELSFTEQEYLRAYYQPVRELFLEFYNREEMKDLRIQGIDCVEARITLPYFIREDAPDEVERSFILGMPRELIENGIQSFADIPKEWHKLKDGIQDKYGQSCYVGGDFVYIRCT